MNKFRHEIEEQDSAHSSVTCEITQSANGQRTMPSSGQEGHVYGGGDGRLLQLGESREQQTSGWLAFAICHLPFAMYWPCPFLTCTLPLQSIFDGEASLHKKNLDMLNFSQLKLFPAYNHSF